LEEEQNNLAYDKEYHDALQQQQETLIEFDELKRHLDVAEKSVDQERISLIESESGISNLQRIIEEESQKRDTLIEEIQQLGTVPEHLAKAETEYSELLNTERHRRDELATLQERSRLLGELEQNKLEKAEQLNQYSHEESIYKELTEAFSKKGIQAILIEQALPEIENEANRLLGRMTDNRMSLKLESQRETRAKETNVIETLDIRISDELGTRNYEMFSGGEAFRIDLALRIALSRLLVRRAGASLPILIIDEGFGTQDNTGRERLIEAINSIQEDFEKIFVITHLEDLKEKFPVLIQVTRSTDGSTIAVI
jgi:exonuclease SbcC